jgi:hypothetical protein
MTLKKNTSRGFVRTIIVIVIALLVISYFGLNLREIAGSQTTKDNFGYVWGQVVRIWNIGKDLVLNAADKNATSTQGTAQ